MKPMQKCKLKILTLVMAIVITIAGFLALFLGGGVSKKGNATTIANDLLVTNYSTAKRKFNAESMSALFQKITGISNASISDVSTLANTARTMAYFRTKNNNQPITITLGGKDYLLTYLSKADYSASFNADGTPKDSSDKTNRGDVLLTIMQKTITKTSQWNTYAVPSGNSSHHGQVYGSSYIRSVTLNAGTRYVNSLTGLASAPGQETNPANNEWVNYTVKGLQSSLTDYIAQPKYSNFMAYECWQCVCDRGGYYNSSAPCGNEAFDTPGGHISGHNHPWSSVNNSGSIQNEAQYKDWKNDYVWLPSLYEMGWFPISGYNGYWDGLQSEFATNQNWWFRSAIAVNNAANANEVHSSNADAAYTTGAVNSSWGVRACMMLNLSEIMRSGAGADVGTVPSSATLTYDGNPHTFAELFPSLCATHPEYNDSAKVKIEYSDTICNAGTYTIDVTLLDDGLYFSGTVNNADANRKKTVTVTVNKKEIDFSGVTWSANSLEFNGANQKVTITSGLPAYFDLSATVYNSGATGMNVGSYTAKVTQLAISDPVTAANYKVPTTPAELAVLDHTWQITKKKIDVVWQMNGKEAQAGTGIYVPIVQNDPNNVIEYTYFAENGTTPKTLADIVNEHSVTQQKTYVVCAKLKSASASTSVFNADNCVLFYNGTDVTANGARVSFTTGDTKTPVTVGINPNSVTYNGSAQPVTVTFNVGGLTTADFVVTYTMQDGSAIPAGKADSSGVPIGAGEYKVKIALSSSKVADYAITGNSEFDYTINKASYNVSDFRWVDETGAQYLAPFPWAAGVTHTISYSGTAPAGLTYAFTDDTADNATASDVGSYHLVVKFTVSDPDNYNTPANAELTWEITSGTLDLSQVKWDYTGPFTFEIVDGVPVEHEMRLINVPAELEGLIDYSGDTGKYSNAGTYTTSFTVDTSDPMYANFGMLTFPEAATSSLTWEIKALTFEKPNALQTETYRDEGYTFDDIAGFPAGWEEYFDVTVKDSDENDVPLTDGAIKLVNVDNYRVIINFKSNMNASAGGSADNVTWSDGGLLPCQVAFRLQQLVLALNGWTERGGNIRPRMDAEATVLPQIEKYFDTVVVNTETDEEVPSATALGWETVYTIALRLKAEYAGNVAVEYMGTQGDSTAPYAFMTDVDPTAPPPTNFYRKPTEEEAHVYYRYTGKEVAFKLGDWFVEDKMQILSSAGSAESLLKGTDEGDYIVRVGFKKGARSAWEPASAVPADRAPVTITFTISKDAKLGDRFILKDGITVPFVFLYDDFSDVGAIEEYAFNADKLAYVSRLSLGDTLSALLSQFENGADITVYDLDGTTVITDLETVVATGMYLRLMDGETMLNQLILSVLGEITGDGIINLKDKAQLNSYTLGTTKLMPAQLLASDITGDGIINLKDKAQLNSYTLGTNALPVTPITVPAPSSVSEVWEGAEVTETHLPVSLSEITEVQPAHTTSTQPTKVGFTTVATDHRAATSQFVFPPDNAKKKYLF